MSVLCIANYSTFLEGSNFDLVSCQGYDAVNVY